MGPFVLPQYAIIGRYLQREWGEAVSVRAGIPHHFKCAAAAVQLLSHPLLSHPQTHPVGVRTCYHPPFYHSSHLSHPQDILWVFGRPITPFITPPGLSPLPWAPCELQFITRGTQDIKHPPHPVVICLIPKMLSKGCIILCQLRTISCILFLRIDRQQEWAKYARKRCGM